MLFYIEWTSPDFQVEIAASPQYVSWSTSLLDSRTSQSRKALTTD